MPERRKAETERSREDELAKFEELRQQAASKQAVNRERREEIRDNPRLQEQVRAALIADLLRVYEDPCNPYAGFAASRKRYRQLGHWPEIIVEDCFGTHAEFQRAAGLRDSRGTSKSQQRSARLHTEQEIARFARENVTRFHGQFHKLKGNRKHLEGIVFSDAHSKHCDPFARSVLLSVIEMVQPDVVVANGDLCDFPSVSTHPKLPGHFHLSLQGEIDWCRDLLRDIRQAAPNAAIYFVVGNHEYRLVRYLADTAPALASLRSLRFDELFGLAEYEVSLVCRSNFLAPSSQARKADLAENWIDLGGYLCTHGTALGANPARKELERFAMSGTSGHVHRGQVVYDHRAGTGPMSWMSTPMMCHPSDGSDFVHSFIPWTMGFGRFSLDPVKRVVSQHIVDVHMDDAFYAGQRFKPTKDVAKARRELSAVG